MKRKALFGVILVLAISMTASAWDVLAHSYIMEQIKGGPGDTNGNEIYGITSPDFVNYLIGTPYYDWLYSQTHKNFMRVWHMAGNGNKADAEQSLAMGFVAHNGLWGADYTAHVSSLTIGDPAHGYVIAKAMLLEQIYAGYGIWTGLGLDGNDYQALRLELCHNIIEYAIDVAVWQTDPGIAARVVAAAAGRDASMQTLVKTAYAGLLVGYSQKTDAPLNHPAALALLQTYENAFQTRVVAYATLFASASTPEQVLSNLDGYLSTLAAQIFGLTLDQGEAAQLLGVVFQAHLLDDLGNELGATVNYVRDQLVAHKIVYGNLGQMKTLMSTEPKARLGK